MTGFCIVMFMVVGFTLCGLWQGAINRRQRRAEEAAEAARRQREALAAQDRAEKERQRRAIAAERKAEQDAQRVQREADKDERERRKRAEADARRQARQEAQRQHAREMAELKEREFAAARELARLNGRGERRAAIPAPAPEAVTLEGFAAAHAAVAAPAPAPVPDAPKPFKGHVVAFTGTLKQSGMKRREAVEKVIQAGGRAYDKGMPAGTTLLVVGNNPGMCKLDKADEWIGQVRKITEAQFLEMFAA